MEITPRDMRMLNVPLGEATTADPALVELARKAMDAKGDEDALASLSRTVRPVPRRVPKVVEFADIAPSTMSFRDAIKNRMVVPEDRPPETEYFSLDPMMPEIVSVLQTYPSVADDLLTLSSGTLAYHLARLYYKGPPSDFQRQYAIVFNAPLVYDLDVSALAALKMYPPRFRAALTRIYDVDTLRDILRKKTVPAERVLEEMLDATRDDLFAIADQIGMDVQDNILESMLRDMPAYAPAIAALHDTSMRTISSNTPLADVSAALANSTDRMIRDETNVAMPQWTREERVSRIAALYDEDTFFLVDKINPSRAVNGETTLGTPVRVLRAPFLVVGTIPRYQVLELAEFSAAWHGVEVPRTAGLVDVQRPDKEYSVSALNRLRFLFVVMRHYSHHRVRATALARAIDGNLSVPSPDSNMAPEIRDALTRETTPLLRDWLWQLFYLLMYRRSWRGPGTPYPTSPGVSLDAHATLQSATVDQAFNRMHAANGGPSLVHVLEQVPLYEHRDERFLARIDSPETDQPAIDTIYYYLYTLFDEPIRGYSVYHQREFVIV